MKMIGIILLTLAFVVLAWVMLGEGGSGEP